MLVIIGKIENTNGRLEACRVVDTETLEVKDVSMKRIRKSVTEGVRVKGLIATSHTDLYSENVRKATVKEKGLKFRWGKIPQLNGSGQLINSADEKYLTVYGWKGFAEAKKYYLLNYKGEQIILDLKNFTEKVKRDEVNGATMDKKNMNIPLISKELDMEIV